MAPGSLGQHDDHFGGLGVTVISLTFVNFAVALVVTIVGVARGTGRWWIGRARLPDMQFALSVRVSELLSRTVKVLLAAVGIAAVASAAYGAVLLPAGVYGDHGHFYRRVHGTLLPISHAEYATATHPALVMGAGIVTILQVIAFCLTLLAIDRLSFRAHGITGWPELESAVDTNATAVDASSKPQRRRAPTKRRW